MNNMRQLCLGMHMYADAYNGFIALDGGTGNSSDPITEYTSNVSPTGSGTTVPCSWDDLGLWWNGIPQIMNLQSYYDQQTSSAPLPAAHGKGILICPTSDEPTSSSSKDTISGGYFQVTGYKPGSTTSTEVLPMYVTYAINSKLNTERGRITLEPNGTGSGGRAIRGKAHGRFGNSGDRCESWEECRDQSQMRSRSGLPLAIAKGVVPGFR